MSENRDRLLTIVASLVDETIGEDEVRELNALLDGHPENQLLYKRCLDLHCQLDWSSHLPDDLVAACAETRIVSMTDRTPVSVATERRNRAWIAAAVGTGGVALVLLVLLLIFQSSTFSIEAALSDFEGEVVVKRANGETRPVSRGMDIVAGDAIETRGSNSFATLEFSDHSRFVLVSDAVAALDESNLKHVVFRRGRLIASVEDQSATQPFVVAAPHAKVEVLGTKFALESLEKQTNLNVMEGHVGVTSAMATNSREVGQGQYLVAFEGRPFVVEESTADDNGWSEDFEDGLPDRWHSGQFESEQLPTNSKGGVRAARNEIQGAVFYQAISQQEWARGLFAYHDDLHLQVTCKMERPSWINVFFIARTNDPQNPKTFLHKFDRFPMGEPGEWCKVTIPLSEFQAQTSKGFEDISPTEDELVFGLSFSAPESDRGLVIDQLSVKRGGPGRVVFERLK